MTNATAGLMSSPSARLFEQHMNELSVELVLAALPNDAVRKRLKEGLGKTEGAETIGWDLGGQAPVPVGDFIKSMHQSASSDTSVADRVAQALGRNDYTDLVREEPAATVLAILDEAGQKQLGERVIAAYGSSSEELMTRVAGLAGQDTTRERPAAIAIALDRAVSDDAVKYPNPLNGLRRDESTELLLQIHQLKVSLNPDIKKEITSPHLVMPLQHRPFSVHTPVSTNRLRYHSLS